MHSASHTLLLTIPAPHPGAHALAMSTGGWEHLRVSQSEVSSGDGAGFASLLLKNRWHPHEQLAVRHSPPDALLMKGAHSSAGARGMSIAMHPYVRMYLEGDELEEVELGDELVLCDQISLLRGTRNSQDMSRR
jgi:hypothetical protein